MSRARTQRPRRQRTGLPPKERDWKEGQTQVGLFVCDGTGMIVELIVHKAGATTKVLAHQLADAILADLAEQKTLVHVLGKPQEPTAAIVTDSQYRVSMTARGRTAFTCGYGVTLEQAKDAAVPFFKAVVGRWPTELEKRRAVVERAVTLDPEDGEIDYREVTS